MALKLQFIAHRRKKDGMTQNLWEHLKEVSDLAGQFANKVGLEDAGKIIGLLHDLGKASKEFDQYIRPAVGIIDPDQDDYVDASGNKGKVDHSTAGAQIIQRYFASKGTEGILTAQLLSLCIASHHSGLIDCLTPDGHDNYHRRMEKPETKTHVSEAVANLTAKQQQELDRLLSKELTKELTSCLAAVREHNDSKETLMFKCGLLVRFLFSCLIDADRLNTADFEHLSNAKLRNQGKYVPWDTLIERLERRLEYFPTTNGINEIRQSISKECLEFSSKPEGLYQLTVPTGGGKTLASLRFALSHAAKHKMDRIVYVVPYTSIIDQNAEEVRKILEDTGVKGMHFGNVVLEHHSNLTPDKETLRHTLLAENWDTPLVFITSVQFLEAMFSSGTRSARRMHQLANSVIIFDEVQTIPVRCVHMFNIGIRFLLRACGSTVVLCTATQPLLDRIEPRQRSLEILSNQQMIGNVEGLFQELKRVTVSDLRKVGGWTDKEVTTLVTKELRTVGSVLVVVNTKQSARNLYQEICWLEKTSVYHLSTDMCPAHRSRVLKIIKARLDHEKPTVCVSTQLIEAGVDIDFGSVIRYLAGLDSIAQTAGRCNRHGSRAKPGNVFILNPKEENLNRLEDIRIGAEKAERVLDEFKESPERFDGDILGPTAMEQFYRYYFYERQPKMDYPVSSRSSVGRDDSLFDLLSTNTLSVQEYERVHHSSPPMLLRQSFQAALSVFRAIESPTRGIIVPYGGGKRIIEDLCAADDVEKQYRLMKRAQRYSVNIYPHVFDDLCKRNALHAVQEGVGVFFLDSQHYCKEFGVSKEIVNEMEILIR